MRNKIKLLFLLLLFSITVNSQVMVGDSTKLMQAASTSNMPVSNSMMQYFYEDLPMDTAVLFDAVKSNKLVYYIQKEGTKNAETTISVVYKVGSLLEDSSKIGVAFFTANYIAKYYESKIIANFSTKVDSTVTVESKPEFTKFIFNIIDNTDKKNETIHDFFEFLSDSIPFNATRLAINKSNLISQYKLNFPSELPYRNVKEPSLKYLNAITITKLKQFYKDWYRPNLTAVLVAGAVNAEQIKLEINSAFSKVKNPVKEKKIVYYSVPKISTLLLSIISDSTLTDKGIVDFYYKIPRTNRASFYGLIENIMGGLASMVINNIYNKYVEENKITKFSNTISYFPFTKNIDVIKMSLICDISYLDSLTLSLVQFADDFKATEIINQKDLDYEKAVYLNNLEKNKNNSFTTANCIFNYTNHFINHYPLIAKLEALELSKGIIEKLKVNEINEYIRARINLENTAIVIRKPINTKLLFTNKQELLKIYNKVFPKK